MTTVSVAIPCYRSALTLPTVVADIRAAICQRPDYDYQIILVNDSPNDAATTAAIARLCQEDKKGHRRKSVPKLWTDRGKNGRYPLC
jgi:glycosyltransferase involved in cell wall biosynthesis